MDGQWPQAVLGDEFKPEREGVRKAIQGRARRRQARRGRPRHGRRPSRPPSIGFGPSLRKLVPQTSPDYVSAHWSLKAMDGLTKMLYSPTMDKVLAELEDYQGTNLGDLLGFMQAFNLRFGAAKSYRQRLIYQKLYPMLRRPGQRIDRRHEQCHGGRLKRREHCRTSG